MAGILWPFFHPKQEIQNGLEKTWNSQKGDKLLFNP